MNDRVLDLRGAIEQSGYYPDVVSDAVTSAIAGETVVSFLVHHEPTIDERDEVRRHVTVLVLTPTRLILAHTDEHAPDDLLPAPYTSTSTEAVTLTAVRSVVVNRMVANPASYAGPANPGLDVLSASVILDPVNNTLTFTSTMAGPISGLVDPGTGANLGSFSWGINHGFGNLNFAQLGLPGLPDDEQKAQNDEIDAYLAEASKPEPDPLAQPGNDEIAPEYAQAMTTTSS